MKKNRSRLQIIRLGSAAGVLALGIAGAVILVKTKPRPDVVPPEEPVLSVRLQSAVPRNHPVMLTAYGTAESIRSVALAAEVGGRVEEMPRKLSRGDLVEKGELLLRLDDRDYRAALQDARASVARLNANLESLETNIRSETKLLEVSTRSLALARNEYERLQRLHQDGEAVSISSVEAAERTLNQVRSEQMRLQQSLDLADPRRKELESQLVSARANVERAERNVERCALVAPFSGRILECRAEEDAYVQPGVDLIRLADDSALEIPVSLPADEVRNWLPFNDTAETAATADRPGWFPPIPALAVEVEWTGAKQARIWTGTLDRIVDFDPGTRTVTLAVVLRGVELQSQQGFPLTPGMFCEVRIPGREAKDAYRLPRVAVTFDGNVYISEGGRLQTAEVEIVRDTGEHVLVRGGLNPGDEVVVTRLVAPLEGARLRAAEDPDA